MTALQKAQHTEIYTQLRLQLLDPGDTYAGVRKVYQPVNKDDWTFDYAMTQPDTPAVAYLRARERRMWLTWKVA
jgi:hypothetical protein